MLLDAVICHFHRSQQKSISHDQAFNQHEVFRASVIAEYQLNHASDTSKPSSELEGIKPGQEEDVSLVIDDEWSSIPRLREKLLESKHDGSPSQPSNKRWVIVGGR